MQITGIIKLLKTKLSQYDITLYKGATNELIKHFEEKLDLQLPPDIKDFYRFCNGFESAEDLFRLIPLQEILEHTYKYQPGHFYIAEYLTYCDLWEVELNPGNTGDYKIFNTGVEGKLILTNSFPEFLHRFLTGGVFETNGLYQWHEEKKRIDTPEPPK